MDTSNHDWTADSIVDFCFKQPVCKILILCIHQSLTLLLDHIQECFILNRLVSLSQYFLQTKKSSVTFITFKTADESETITVSAATWPGPFSIKVMRLKIDFLID